MHDDAAALEPEPTFRAYTAAPTIANVEDVVAALRDRYPPLLREAGVGGTVRVWFHVDAVGLVTHARLDENSGHAALDDAAPGSRGVPLRPRTQQDRADAGLDQPADLVPAARIAAAAPQPGPRGRPTPASAAGSG